jgi:hypothetical protein
LSNVGSHIRSLAETPDRQSAFHFHVLHNGVGHVYIKPHTPRLNSKVEPSRRIDAEEFYHLLDAVLIDDAKVFNDKLREWESCGSPMSIS